MNFWDRYDAGIQIEAFMRAFRIGMDGLHMLGEGIKQIADTKKQWVDNQQKWIENHCEVPLVHPSEPAPGIYKHYKGVEYVVTGVAIHTETNEWMVIYYQIRWPEKLFVRPLAMFCGEVVVDGEPVRRFVHMRTT